MSPLRLAVFEVSPAIVRQGKPLLLDRGAQLDPFPIILESSGKGHVRGEQLPRISGQCRLNKQVKCRKSVAQDKRRCERQYWGILADLNSSRWMFLNPSRMR